MSRVISSVELVVDEFAGVIVCVWIGCVSEDSDVFALVYSFEGGRWMIGGPV